MYDWQLLIYALLLEAISVYFLIVGAPFDATLASYLLFHGAASAVLARGVWGLMPVEYREPRFWSRLLIFALAFLVPVVGLLTMLAGVVVNHLLPAAPRDPSFGLVSMPRFTPGLAPSSGSFRQEDLKSLLTSAANPTELRLRGMTTVRAMSTRITGPVLRQVLGDPVDDVRLLACGILNQKEKELARQISRAMALLDSAGPGRRYRLSRRLAELYWEMSYQDLVLGDIRTLTLKQALRYTDLALAERPDDIGMWLLRGRILMNTGVLDEAEQCFSMCRELGTDASRVNPWMAELALWRGRYDRVRALMDEIAEEAQFTSLSKVADYWRRA